MWAALATIIPTLLTTLLPLIIKLVLVIIEKRQDSDEAKKKLVELIQEIQKDPNISEKARTRYNAQIERIMARIKDE